MRMTAAVRDTTLRRKVDGLGWHDFDRNRYDVRKDH